MWRPISELPEFVGSDDEIEDSPRLLVWVADYRRREKGTVAFGSCSRHDKTRIYWRAEGYSVQGWKITHWMPLPEGPK